MKARPAAATILRIAPIIGAIMVRARVRRRHPRRQTRFGRKPRERPGPCRRGPVGHHHHIAGRHRLRIAQDASWREEYRRVSNGDKLRRLTATATMKATFA